MLSYNVADLLRAAPGTTEPYAVSGPGPPIPAEIEYAKGIVTIARKAGKASVTSSQSTSRIARIISEPVAFVLIGTVTFFGRMKKVTVPIKTVH